MLRTNEPYQNLIKFYYLSFTEFERLCGLFWQTITIVNTIATGKASIKPRIRPAITQLTQLAIAMVRLSLFSAITKGRTPEIAPDMNPPKKAAIKKTTSFTTDKYR